MSIGTLLILLLKALVGIVMVAAVYYWLQQRKGILESLLHNEVRTHAATLQLRLEEDIRAGRDQEAQQFINPLSQNPKIYSVLYDEQGQIIMLSASHTSVLCGHFIERIRHQAAQFGNPVTTRWQQVAGFASARTGLPDVRLQLGRNSNRRCRSVVAFGDRTGTKSDKQNHSRLARNLSGRGPQYLSGEKAEAVSSLQFLFSSFSGEERTIPCHIVFPYSTTC